MPLDARTTNRAINKVNIQSAAYLTVTFSDFFLLLSPYKTSAAIIVYYKLLPFKFGKHNYSI